jgi:hypothetical protein
MASISVRPESVPIYLLVFFALLNPSLAMARSKRTNTIVMRPMLDGRAVGFLCGINGSKPVYNCIIDSGASNTLVSDRILKPEGPVRHVITGGGVIPVHEQSVSFRLTDGLDVNVMAYVQLMTLDGMDVLIGQDFLRHFKSVVFDYERGQVKFQQ